MSNNATWWRHIPHVLKGPLRSPFKRHCAISEWKFLAIQWMNAAKWKINICPIGQWKRRRIYEKKIAEIFALFMECIRAWIASFDCIGREIIGQMYFQEFRGRRDIDLIVLTLFSSHLLAKELNQLVQWVAFSQDRILRIRLLWRFFLMTQQLGHSPNINFKGWREAETVLSPVAWNFSLKSCLS